MSTTSTSGKSSISIVKLSLLFLTVLCGISVASKCLRGDCKGIQKDSDWDYILFVNQWPESFCLYYNASHSHEDKSQKCIIPAGVNNWTIHGTWPTKRSTEGPVFCNNTWQFDLSKIKDLVPELNKVWPDFLSGGPYSTFWSHEWDKHGTCAASLPALHGEHNYFGTTIKLKLHFNIFNILSKNGIVPSPTAKYSHDDIMQAVKNGTGGVADLVCFQKTDSSGFYQYLAEIRLCLDKSFKPFDCPKSELLKYNSVYYSTCSSKTAIALPPITH